MSARRLLLLCYFYPPLAGGGVHRVLGFTRHLPDHGWDCTVVCAGAEDYWVTDESLVTRVPPDTEVIRVSGGSALSAWLQWRSGERGRRSGRVFSSLRAASDWWLLPDSYAGWSRRARTTVARLLASRASGPASRRVHAVLSSSPPDSVHFSALGLPGRFRLPWIADFRDAWIGTTYRTPPTAWHRRRQTGLERRVLEGADAVVTASGTHARSLERRSQEEGIAVRRLVHIPNGFEAVPAGDATAPLREPGGGDAERFTIVFTGTLSMMPDTEVFLEALHDLLARRPEARRRLHARLAGPFDSDYADRAVALGLHGIVEFMGPRPHGETRALQRRADLLVLWKPRNCPSMVPGKLYEYLDAGRPVLAVLAEDEEAADLVRRAGGALTPPGDRTSLAGHVERHYLAWKAGAPITADRPGWIDGHSRGRLAARLASVLDRLVEGES